MPLSHAFYIAIDRVFFKKNTLSRQGPFSSGHSRKKGNALSGVNWVESSGREEERRSTRFGENWITIFSSSDRNFSFLVGPFSLARSLCSANTELKKGRPNTPRPRKKMEKGPLEKKKGERRTRKIGGKIALCKFSVRATAAEEGKGGGWVSGVEEEGGREGRRRPPLFP